MYDNISRAELQSLLRFAFAQTREALRHEDVDQGVIDRAFGNVGQRLNGKPIERAVQGSDVDRRELAIYADAANAVSES